MEDTKSTQKNDKNLSE